MHARAPLALTILAGAFLVQTAIADPVGHHFELTPFGGFTVFDGDQRVHGNPITDDLYLGGRIGYQFHPWWAIEVAGGFTPSAEDATNGLDVDFYHYSGNLMFTPWGGLYGGPYAFAGAGNAQITPSGQSGESHGDIEAGAGVRFWLSDRIGLRLEARQVYYSAGGLRINDVVAGGGLVFALGAKGRDTDQDGVSDRKDTCPNTPKGATVDANGCPKDSDLDGVLDGLDKCPDTRKGCTVDKNGCPSDADGDQVCDGIDQCADTPKGATVDEKGCPKDSDGDGVPDGLDKCPDTSPGLRVDVQGCPIEVMDRETELLDTGMIRLQNVNFETAKADILPESFPVLDVVGQVLKKWPELRIEIGGHTDARGSDRYNQRLSEARAKSVLDYLTHKFPELKPEQFTAKGYGESKPLVPNTNDLNMAKNRRVEFVVLNKDVLKREVERRRLLKKGEGTPAPTPVPAPTPAPPDTTQH